MPARPRAADPITLQWKRKFMSLADYRASESEKLRTEDILRHTPQRGRIALDIGARDGHFSLMLADRFDEVIALDLTMPTVAHPRVRCVKGDAAALELEDRSVDFVLCAEVLEHVPPQLLPRIGREIERVARGPILIGVPYRQDIRVGRTTCSACHRENPPWGHMNSFDEHRLSRLFPNCDVQAVSFVGTNAESTNAVSTWLMDRAGNPYGTYSQEEPCIHCGQPLGGPAARSLTGKVLTKLAWWSRALTQSAMRPHGNWIHMRLMPRLGEAARPASVATPVDSLA